MNNTQLEIIDLLTKLWDQNPEFRFGQLLTNVNILEFANTASPEDQNYNLRDIYSDSDNSTLNKLKISYNNKLKIN